jgi:hypothetical protein
MTYLWIGVAVVLFSLGLRHLGLIDVARDVVATARRAADVIRAADLDESEKERAVRAAALSLFGLFGSITWRTLACVAVPTLVILAAARLGIADLVDVVAASTRWQVIVVTALLMTAIMLVRR